MNNVIIGYGVASYWAAKTIRKYLPDDKITIITGEPHPAYFKVNISRYLLSRNEFVDAYIPDLIKPDKNFEVRISAKISKLDINSKIISIDDGSDIKFDNLLIASGLKCLPNKGISNGIAGVFSYNYINDAIKLSAFAQEADNLKAVVMCGNLYCFEIIRSLSLICRDITLILPENGFSELPIDEESKNVVINKLSMGIKIERSSGIKKFISPNGILSAIELNNGKIIEAGLAVLSQRFEPCVDFAPDFMLGQEGRIKVNANLRTEIPYIYAAGDAALCDGENTGLAIGWRRAWLQGVIAGSNIAGYDKTYCAAPSIRAQINGYPIVAIGDINHNNTDEYKIISYKDDINFISKKLFIKDNLPAGAVFVGNIDNISIIEQLIENKEPVDDDELISIEKFVSKNINPQFQELFCPVCKSNIDLPDYIEVGTKLKCPICVSESVISEIKEQKQKILMQCD